MRDELYINGELADMNNSGVNMTYKSNLLADLNKIVGNYSQSIKLPKTAHNMRLIGGAVLPSSTSQFPYIIHGGRLVRDGVVIVDKANVVLLSVSDDIEVSLVWGSISELQELVNSEATLADLGWDDNSDYVNLSYVLGTIDVPYIHWGIDITPTTTLASCHPVISFKNKIVPMIEEKSGVTFSFPNSIYTLAIPLTSQNVHEKNLSDAQVTLLVDNFFQENAFFNVVVDEIKNSYYHTTAEPILGNIVNIVAKTKNLKIVVDYEIYCSVTSYNSADYLKEHLTCSIMGYEVLPVLVEPNQFVDYGYYVRFSGTTEEIELKAETEVKFASISQSSIIGILGQEYAGFNATFTLYPKIEDLRQGANYYYSVNMPEVRITDLIKTYMRMHGCYIRTEDKKVIFEYYSKIYENIASAVDWSDKLITTSTMPSNMEFTVPEIAQVNYFRYKEDDKTTGEYDSFIAVNDQTLDKSKDLFNSAFSATDENGEPSALTNSLIPIYSYDDKGEVKYKDVKPRIISLRYNQMVWKGTFYGLDWATLINRYYDSYKRMITNAKIISETIRLTPIELKNLDMYTPIYLRQYGAYFAVLEIKTKDNNNNEVKLLKL